ncbi:HTTM domain-containing protein [Agromyces cerinus]|uniref:Vitamin K-dependent gamma-carboxylase n=1 Tax=Agromyces cerinus subsp. cerinus TaxID=232089 RepID=A0A1N6DIM5_9MICO|nr:HTTM domain-containing protein [Agromyces cerinus]SIN70586.1 Vitamin K-dependent gamma-carboxylase [Agromyces cerinus subsp. cerinus]
MSVTSRSTADKITSIWIRQWATPTRTLALSRIAFAGGLLFIWVPTDAAPLGRLAGELFAPPLGPMAVLPEFPPEAFLLALELLSRAALILILMGWRTRDASLAFALSESILAGTRYSTGKIDHDILLYTVVPAVMAFSGWGETMSIDSYQSRIRRRSDHSALAVAAVALAVGAMFFTSGLAKAATGWLRPDGSALEAWATLYANSYGLPPAGTLLLETLPGWAWKCLDLATVLFELGFFVAIALRPVARFYVIGAAIFHIGILFVLGIDFSKLVLVYLILIGTLGAKTPSDRGHPNQRERPALVVWRWPIAITLALLSLWQYVAELDIRTVVPHMPTVNSSATVGLLVLLIFTTFAAITVRRSPECELQPRLPPIHGLAAAFAVAFLACSAPVITYLASEPYPSIMGPLFMGNQSTGGVINTTTQSLAIRSNKHERAISATELFGITEPYATNLALFHFPAPADGASRFAELSTLGHRFAALPLHARLSDAQRVEAGALPGLATGDELIVRWTRTEYREGAQTDTRVELEYVVSAE